METIRKSPGTGIALEAMAVFCLALAIRLIDLGHGYGGNELFHMLAARSWLDEGTFRVAHGIYDRNSEFTVLLAWLTRVFGEGPMVGRLPAVIAGSLLPVALFAWCRMSVGRTAGWFAAILLCVCPLAITMSQWVRVYAIHALAFFLGAAAVHVLLTATLSRRSAWLIGTAGAFFLALAMYLHYLAVVGLGGLLLWAIFERRSALKSLAGRVLQTRARRASTLFVIVAITGLLILSGGIETLLAAFVDLQPQAADKQYDYLYYHRWLLEQYPLLWGATPVVLIVAIARKPGFGCFCTSIFLTVFIVYVFASRKWLRYLYYVMPFLFALWGFILAEVLPYVRRSIAGVVARLSPGAGRPVLRRFATLIAWGGVAAFVAGSNAVVLPVYYKLSGAGSRGADWESAAPLLEPWLADPGAIVMASPMQEPLFYYGRADIEFGPKYIYESDTGAELGVDGRTGLRVISTRESMELVFACHERGVLLVESSKWRRPGFGPSDDVLGFLELHARELPEAKNAGLTVFAWDGSSASPGADCSRLRPLDVAR